MDKTKLDEILDKHKAQPVRHGYIDIIVSRDNYKELITDLVNNCFSVKSISWWEWCEGKRKMNMDLADLKASIMMAGFLKYLLTLMTLF